MGKEITIDQQKKIEIINKTVHRTTESDHMKSTKILSFGQFNAQVLWLKNGERRKGEGIKLIITEGKLKIRGRADTRKWQI